ncbi:MAG: ATP synthase F1 subunit gamma [Candidatus Paceibacterota bacterium]|jgi:F-type H+-transporting ATPase subunit gamma
MAVGKELKRRIKSIRNTKKITKAMELVAASKMRRAIASTLASRPYASYSDEVLQSLSQIKTEVSHPLLEVREPNRILVILITSNRGLCGAYNAQVIREAVKFIKSHNLEAKPPSELSFITIGKKGDAMLRRLGQNIIASFADLPDTITLRDIIPVANLIIETFKKKETDQVSVLFTDFISALSQKSNLKQVLPIVVSDMAKSTETSTNNKLPTTNYLFEPNYDILMPLLVEKLAKMQLFQMILESRASEESSRMVAMKNASEAAGEMIDDLTLIFNKARQASITQEISEISAGMASVS